GGRIGMIQKVHHALIDGVSSVDVMTKLLDPTPEFEFVEPPPWQPDPLPTPFDLAQHQFQTQFGAPFGAAGAAPYGMPGQLAQEQIQDLSQAFQSMQELGPLDETSLNAPVGPYR